MEAKAIKVLNNYILKNFVSNRLNWHRTSLLFKNRFRTINILTHGNTYHNYYCGFMGYYAFKRNRPKVDEK